MNQIFTLDELTFLFSEEMLGVNVAQFPLIVTIIT